MNLEPERGWWKTLFDEVYLKTDARSVCNRQITGKEIDLVCSLLRIEPKHRILDLCGGHGRHTLELFSRGFKDCTLVDYSGYLLSRAMKSACANGSCINCVRADARNTGMRSGRFDRVLILGNSLGYFSRKNEDLAILSETHRLLRPGGWLLVDVADGEAVRKKFTCSSWHEVEEDIVVCREREMVGDRVHAREVVLSKKNGLVRDRNYAIRVYDKSSLTVLIEKAGYTEVKCHNDLSFYNGKSDRGFMNHRIFAVGRRPGKSGD